MAKDKKHQQKRRVAFRKNRTRRARQTDFTRELDVRADDEAAATIEDLPSTERLSGKGDLTRHRTVMVSTQDSAAEHRPIIEVDASECLRGRVVAPVGLNSMVQTEDGRQFECTVRRLIRTMSRETRNAVVAGDWVLLRPLDQRSGVIERVEPRKTVLARGSKGHEHVIVANIDQIVIVASAAEPTLKPSLIDRFLISAAKGAAGGLICINKADLVEPQDLQPLLGVYGQLGYRTVLVSATTGDGVDRLKELLKDRQSVVAGQSGVGKSSILNAVQPGLHREVSSISGWTQKGRHTTRMAELLPLEFGGWVVDTPGIRQMELWDVLPEEVEGFFVEFRPFVAYCQFPDCTHTHESGCRVKRAVSLGLISNIRYQSYLKILSGQEE